MAAYRVGMCRVSLSDFRRTSNQLVLYHASSHAVTVQPHTPDGQPAQKDLTPRVPRTRPRPLLLPYRSHTPTQTPPPVEIPRTTCPYCNQTLPSSPTAGNTATESSEVPLMSNGYFQILERAYEGSRPPSPRLREKSQTPFSPLSESEERKDEDEDLPAKGYYERYFREEKRLGMGAEGSVYLATHIIGENVLGT